MLQCIKENKMINANQRP